MTKDEAITISLSFRKNMKVVGVRELEKCFVVNTVPEKFDENSGDLFIGGAIRVDKKTGKCNLFNPMIEGMR